MAAKRRPPRRRRSNEMLSVHPDMKKLLQKLQSKDQREISGNDRLLIAVRAFLYNPSYLLELILYMVLLQLVSIADSITVDTKIISIIILAFVTLRALHNWADHARDTAKEIAEEEYA